MSAPVLWHPAAKRVPIASAPAQLQFTGGGHKVVWHTTEGAGIDGAVGAYKAAGVCPHFTIDISRGKRTLYQHLPINRAASALKHPAGTAPTNTACAIQVEIVGFAAQSGQWSRASYFWLWRLAVWCNKHYGVPMSTPVLWHHPVRLSGAAWVGAKGHVGHMHCPGNDHVDPGTGFHIGMVVKNPLLQRKV